MSVHQFHNPHVIVDCEDGTDPTGDYWAECSCGWWYELNGSLEETVAAVEEHRKTAL